jgi:putative ABC transport system permease protein
LKTEGNHPPKLWQQFFRWFCHPKLRDSIEGDLMELYQERKDKSGKTQADIRFVIDVIQLFRSDIIRPMEGYRNLNTYGMYKNYFKIAWRNLIRNKGYSIINMGGLTVGVTACLIIILYIAHEISYDAHFNNADRIYRLSTELMFSGEHYKLASSPAAAARTLPVDFPEVESAMHFRQWPWRWVKRGTESFKENHIAYASNEIFTVFSLPLRNGNTSNALLEPNTMVISKSSAEKYFPGGDALGQMLSVDDVNYKITGVFNDLPVTTHFELDFILSMAGHSDSKNESWLMNNFNTYILLREGASAKSLESKFPSLVDKYFGPQAKEFFGSALKLNSDHGKGDKVVYSLTPIKDIHLRSHLTMEMGANSDISYVYLFGTIALFIFLIACINFMNLSTARSSNRAKEVGVRKVMGSIRGHLISQFLTESVLLSGFSFTLAIALTYLLLPSFNTLAERTLTLPFHEPGFIFLFISATIAAGVFAGLYPSFFLSTFKPIQALKGKPASAKGGSVRSVLVVSQFMISIFLVIGTIAVQRQLYFIQNKNLGYAKDQVIILHNTETLGNQQQAFRNELTRNSMVTSASVSGYVPISGWARMEQSFWKEGQEPSEENHVSMQCWPVDHDYIPTMGMELGQGRNFSLDSPSDSMAVIINESAVRHFGFKEPIGAKIETFAFEKSAFEAKKHATVTVIGVVKDFHFESLKENITPLCLRLGNSNWSIPVRFNAGNTDQVIAHLEQTWKTFNPDTPFEFTFLDEAFRNMYASERRLGSIFSIFSTLTIVIACLGLFALTAFSAEQRTKEIGVRKVLGASVASIVYLLSKEFGKLIFIAFVISAPLAWYAVDWWLKDYTYKVEVGILVYISAGLFAFLIAGLTMSYQSVKAALTNPVSSLRSE